MELQRDYLNLKPTTQAMLCCIPAQTFSIKDTLNTRDLIRIRPDRKILRTGHKTSTRIMQYFIIGKTIF